MGYQANMNTQFPTFSDKPFVGAFFVISCIGEEEENGERISQFFSHVRMARAFIESCDVVENEMLYIGVVRDEQHKKELLDNIENMVQYTNTLNVRREREMKQQKFFVGDKIERTDNFMQEFGAERGVAYTVKHVSANGWFIVVTDGYSVSGNRYPEYYTIVERAWQENDGTQGADEDTYIEILFNGATTTAVVTVEKEWWENTKGVVKWRITDEYENPKEFFEQPVKAQPPVCTIPPVHVALEEELVAVDVQKKNKYTREIKPNVFVDVYDVLRAFNVTDPCLSHLAKKALAAGQRHHKDRLTDLRDIKASIERAIEMHIEWEK